MIYTSRFANKSINNADHLPVRIARGGPRFRIGYQIEDKIEIIMPSYAEFRQLPPVEAEASYRSRIAAAVPQIYAIFSDLTARAGARKILLLCFEDVHAGQLCHRRLFAEIWQQQTGEIIPEL